VLSKEVVKFLVDSERFYFLKDTSCDMASMSEKLQLIQGSNLKLYNANTATLLESLQEGAAGYSGVMANFHPRLYSWLCKNYAAQPEKARKLTDLLTMCSLIENSNYPVNAKYALQKMGVPMTLHSRRVDWKRLTVAQRMEAEQLIRLSAEVEDELGIAR
jgi:4-hydroxy-tetrahydrodipicolinate synthase